MNKHFIKEIAVDTRDRGRYKIFIAGHCSRTCHNTCLSQKLNTKQLQQSTRIKKNEKYSFYVGLACS